jgi:hypothetical protein
MKKEEVFKISKNYLKERIEVKEKIRKEWSKRSIEEKLQDIIQLRKFFGR